MLFPLVVESNRFGEEGHALEKAQKITIMKRQTLLVFAMMFFSMMLLYLENENYDVMLLSKLTSAEFQSCLIFSLLLLFK